MSNEDVVRKGMKLFLEGRVHNDVLSLLEQLAEKIMHFIASGKIPVLTGNLKDSTGIGIYHGDCLFRYVPNPIAKEPRTRIYPYYLTSRTDIWGHVEIQDAINYGAMKYSNDYWLVIFSAMPYASLIDEACGYFQGIESEIDSLAIQLISTFKKI